MMNLKNQKGSITLFVLISCLFFIAAVVCVFMYMQSKEAAVDREYRQIKSNYEKNIDNMDTIYNSLAKTQNAVSFGTPNIDNTSKTISVEVLVNTEGIDVKTLKYGWFYSATQLDSPSSNNITDWTYVESVSGNNKIIASKAYTENVGYYYLCVTINNSEFWLPVSDYIKDGLIVHYDAINNTGLGDNKHSTTTSLWKDLSGNGNDATIISSQVLDWNSNYLRTNRVETISVPWNFDTSHTISVVFSPLSFFDCNTIWDNSLSNDDNECWIYSSGILRARSIQGTYLLRKDLKLNQKIQLTLVVDSENNIFTSYINGGEISNLEGPYANLNGGQLSFNGNINTKGNNEYYSMMVYNRALTEEEVKQNYQANKIRFGIEEE